MILLGTGLIKVMEADRVIHLQIRIALLPWVAVEGAENAHHSLVLWAQVTVENAHHLLVRLVRAVATTVMTITMMKSP